MAQLVNGNHTFEIVDSIPAGYVVWNIGKNMTDGWLPLCKVIPGTYSVEINTLCAIKVDNEEDLKVLREAAHYGSDNLTNCQKIVKKLAGKELKGYLTKKKYELAVKALPIFQELTKA